MFRTQVYLPEDLYQDAQRFAKLEGVSISEYIRDGLRLKLKQLSGKSNRKTTQPPLGALVGKYGKGSKKTDVARTHDDYLG